MVALGPHKISQGAHKLIWTSTIIKKKNYASQITRLLVSVHLEAVKGVGPQSLSLTFLMINSKFKIQTNPKILYGPTRILYTEHPMCLFVNSLSSSNVESLCGLKSFMDSAYEV